MAGTMGLLKNTDGYRQGMMVALALWLLSSSSLLLAAGVQVQQAQTRLLGNVYYLDARLEYVLTEPMLEAVHKSVPLTFVLYIEVYQQRNYLWDNGIAKLEQRYQLVYQPLTQQYQVRNLNSGSLHNLPSLQIALSVLGTVVDLPLLDQELLAEDTVYQARLQVQLDIEELPVPLRLLSYFSDEWRLRSEWYSWPLQR
jgi:hypothetical protein